MYYKFPAINLKDWFTLVSVWEQSNQGWQRLCTVRLPDAMKLCNQPNRVVFPTSTDLSRKSKVARDDYKFCKVTITKERLLEIIKILPGQTSTVLAKRLDISVPQLRQYLKLLQNENLIHYSPDSFDKKIKRYYLGVEPTITTKSNNNINVVEPKQSLPEVRVYFVNPKLLQRQLQQFH